MSYLIETFLWLLIVLAIFADFVLIMSPITDRFWYP